MIGIICEREVVMDLVENILKDKNLRESLIELRKQFQEEMSLDKYSQLQDKLKKLLQHEDPKVRKNVAILLGYYKGNIPILLEAYHHEEIEYVKEAYLKGISQQNCHEYLYELKNIQQKLLKSEEVSAKHIQAQLKVLNPLILDHQPHKKKLIKLKHQPIDVILTTLPYYQFVVFEHVLPLLYKPISQGVLVRTDSLYDLQSIRVYKEMLIPVGAALLNPNIEDITEGLKRCYILNILERIYDENSFFYYRVVDELREKNSQLIKQVSQKIFELYPQKLLNSSHNYDIEIVLKEVKRGTVNIYLRLSHLSNPRFHYRKNVISNSIHPYVAATLVQIAKPYMKDDAKVLDPFVGTGTLLIEKNIVKPSHFSMGVDIYGQAIEMARKNTKIANQTIYYVHKDALRFCNKEMFDEIITDMPTYAQLKDEKQLTDVYDRFFARIHRLVKPGGYVFLYTSEIALVRKNLRLQDNYLSLEEHYEIPRGKHMFYFFIIRLK